MVHQHEMVQLLLKSGAAWASGLNVPWFLAGAGLGVPAAVGTVSTRNSTLLGLATTLGGLLGGVAADHLSTAVSSNLSLAYGGGFTCYDVLTKGVGPACLLLVVLSGRLRGEPSVAPLFSAYVLEAVGGATGGGGIARLLLLSPKRLTLWAAVVLAYANLSLRLSRGAPGRTVGGYMTALRTLASKERGTGGWSRIGQCGKGGRGQYGVEGKGCDGGGGVGSRPRAHSMLGSLYESLLAAGGWGGGRVCSEAIELSQHQAIYDGPPFERGEVTVRNIYCSGLDAAITGRPPSASSNGGGNGGGFVGGADGGGGGLIAGGSSRPFYVTVSLGGLTSKTSARQGFSPRFTEVFPLGVDCPIRGAFVTIAVVDSFEAGRSGRGDRAVGEVHLPLDAAQLVPGTSGTGRDSFSTPASPFSSGGDGGDGEPTYRLRGEWELQGALGDPLGGARVGADIVVRGPPSPTSAAGRLRRRRRESVGWYAR
ncbi:unnamed protein product [Scytosiphon promiscuus]